MHINKSLFFISIFFTLLFASCKNSFLTDSEYLLLNDNVYWSLCGSDDVPEDVYAYNGSNYHFQRLTDFGNRNLYELTGVTDNYLWLKISFEIPERLKNQDLGLCVDYIHFADKVWINGHFAGEYGQFPPNPKSTLFLGHNYDFPRSMLNQNGNNTILIKVYCLGNAGINGDIILASKKIAELSAGRITMFNSTIYMLFFGTLLIVFLFYMLMYIHNRKMKEYLSFSMLGFSTLIFSSAFFIPQLPVFSYPNFNFFIYYKFAITIGAILIVYFLTSFILNFVKVELTRSKKITRLVYLAALIIYVLVVPDYETLFKSFMPVFVFMLGQMFYCTLDILKALETKEGRHLFKIMLLSLLPMIVTIAYDIVYLGVLHGERLFYLTYFGWQATILSYFAALAIRYNKVSTDFEKLNKNLAQEIRFKTENLKETNAKLQYEVRRSRADMRMAAIVQQKFFPYPSRSFMGWDIAVCYTPVSDVSGDMFDFYSMGSMLDGFALFDVSGHGIAAGLITMLSKNIIYQSFLKSRFGNQKASTILKEINLKITETKGEVENYLTGIICRFDHFKDDDSCVLEMSNAGHPSPVMYDSNTDSVIEIKTEDDENHFGAIGLMGRNVSFQSTETVVHDNDILVFYTDGLTEAENDSGKAFGKERLKQVLKENHSNDAHRILDSITKEMNDFVKNHERTDDITIVVMKRQYSKDYLQEI